MKKLMSVFTVLIFHYLLLEASEVSYAVQKISQEVQFVKKYFKDSDEDFLKALATMNYVVGHVSAPNYAYLRDSVGVSHEVEDVLKNEAGICRSAQDAFMAIAEGLGLQMRNMYIWYSKSDKKERAGHATVEVFYKGKWHWFDPTWGTFYRFPNAQPDEVLCFRQIISLEKKNRKKCAISYCSLLWRQTVSTWSDDVDDYMEYKNLTVQIDSYTGPIIYQR